MDVDGREDGARQAFDAVMAGRIIYVNGRVNRAMVFLAHYMPGGS